MKRLYNYTIDEELYINKIENGLTVFLMPRKNFHRKYALFGVHCGSVDLEFINSGEQIEVPTGIAHFLEHKLFEEKKENIFDKFASLGASANAYTGFTSTNYLFSATSYFKESLVNLLDFVQEPYFTGEGVEKEKGIIAQEINMYRDNPHWQVYFNFLQGLYVKNHVRYDIPGTLSSINNITVANLYKFYDTFYHPQNMILFLTGDFDHKKIIDLIKENQQAKSFSPQSDIQRIFPEEPDYVNSREVSKKMDVSRPLFNFGYKDIDLNKNDRELIKQDITINMLLELIIGRSSKLYQTLYEKGLIDDSFSRNYTLEKSYGYVKFSGETKNPQYLFQILEEELRQVCDNLTVDDFDRIYKKYIGEFIKGFNSFEVIASEFVNFYFRGSNLFEALDIMKEITFEDVVEQSKRIFDSELLVKSVITTLR